MHDSGWAPAVMQGGGGSGSRGPVTAGCWLLAAGSPSRSCLFTEHPPVVAHCSMRVCQALRFRASSRPARHALPKPATSPSLARRPTHHPDPALRPPTPPATQSASPPAATRPPARQACFPSPALPSTTRAARRSHAIAAPTGPWSPATLAPISHFFLPQQQANARWRASNTLPRLPRTTATQRDNPASPSEAARVATWLFCKPPVDPPTRPTHSRRSIEGGSTKEAPRLRRAARPACATTGCRTRLCQAF